MPSIVLILLLNWQQELIVPTESANEGFYLNGHLIEFDLYEYLKLELSSARQNTILIVSQERRVLVQ